MSCLLHIETSAKICSLAVSIDKNLILNKVNKEGFSHSSCLGMYVKEAMDELKKRNLKLDAVSVSMGPGSYTGLRIGVSEAKGLCYGLDIPLIALSSLRILTESAFEAGVKADYYYALTDARRMEVYSAVYDSQGNLRKDVGAEIIDENSFSEFLSKGKVAFFGDGSDKCKDVISSENAIFVPDIYPQASSMISLAEQSFEQKKFVDTAYFEPFYLKEFQATVAKNKVF
ncbi:tRNA (adenosine(37)-N6)-threonylcarbamoyltransferase complex dimerization subunit type 1 TsaB [Bacteroidales bacterium OttesenSCG-928-A17]|nr:tRNA (adenosine(37)-N6)-threonylcarbamoyltransferase complex dimerization subunit type 1 TsaB [Bacteroidales bacterium OttesenSCG-928-A17]